MLHVDAHDLARQTRGKTLKAGLIALGCEKIPGRGSCWTAPKGKVRAARQLGREHLTPVLIVDRKKYAALPDRVKDLDASYWFDWWRRESKRLPHPEGLRA